jgi:hypothetical protein
MDHFRGYLIASFFAFQSARLAEELGVLSLGV